MKKIVKYSAILLAVIAIVCISCTTGATSVQKLGGNPAVVSMGNTIGMSISKLREALGPPEEEGICKTPAMVEGRRAMVQGTSLAWTHAVELPQIGYMGEYGIMTCMVKDIAVAEHREWQEFRQGMLSSGVTDRVDTGLTQAIIDGRIKADEEPDPLDKLIDPTAPKFEI